MTVQILQQKEIQLSPGKGALVSGSISVANGDINLIITDPNGGVVANYRQVSTKSFSFTAGNDGAYIIILDNSNSLSSKSVTVDYSIQNSYLGIPQNIIILFVIVAAIMIVAVFGTRFMARKPKNSIVNSSEMHFFTKQKRDESIVYCPKCGALNSNEDMFCKKCGKNFAKENKTIDEDLERNQGAHRIN